MGRSDTGRLSHEPFSRGESVAATVPLAVTNFKEASSPPARRARRTVGLEAIMIPLETAAAARRRPFLIRYRCVCVCRCLQLYVCVCRVFGGGSSLISHMPRCDVSGDAPARCDSYPWTSPVDGASSPSPPQGPQLILRPQLSDPCRVPAPRPHVPTRPT